ncbi:uncharacterized protein LOC110112014 [Dendrobium catenatum]|uniref:uncharacterized protein LOC110112014 n=1 Tax=Dendrobium catenatum TaxID=906689 RepID=UPI00109EECEF|nr:uncharacterized protein LOC110112014 [Dendrobium catenatum]
MFNTICWNCQGARKKEVGNYLRHLIGAHDVSVVGLIETKMEVFSRTDVDRIVGRDWDFCYQPSVGKAGGILVLWKCSVGSFQVLFKSKQCIMGRFRSLSSFDWEVAVVYADKDTHIRAMAFNEISQHHVPDSPLIVGGDFNCILAQADKKGGRPFSFTAAAKGMSDFMAANELIDLGFSGPSFTWINNKDAGSRISSRLDMFLISSSILDAFQELRVSHLTRIASDHCPILCTVSLGRHRARSYWIKFEDIWASFPRAWQLVSEKWRVPDTGSEASKLNKKCQRTLKALFFWSKNKFKMLNKLRDELDREICMLQGIE